MFASEAGVGVHPAKTYTFIIILSPVGNYYPEGVNPAKFGLKMNIRVGKVALIH